MFESGDRFRVKERGHTGKVIRTMGLFDANGNCVNGSYGVVWDSFPNSGICYYDMSDVKDTWEKVSDSQQIGVDYVPANVNDRLPTGMYPFIGIDPAFAPKPECDHKWVEVGFTFSKIVCKHCDKEKVE